jgi:hypothetical protein
MLGNVGSTLGSQGGGYGLIATKMIKDELLDGTYEGRVDVNVPPQEWEDYNTLLICESVNFVEGSFNVPGGPQPEHYEKIKAVAKFHGRIFHINKKFDFEGFNKRLKLPDLIFEEGRLVHTFMEHGILSRRAVIGDSHALSVWRPGYALDFTPGRTLHGFLKRRTSEEINKTWSNGVVLYFGNIDVRFHLMRQPDPKQATVDLFTRYVELAKNLNNVTLVNLLPVEHESRKIPGTGLYMGKPFYGTRTERMELRDIANTIMNESGLNTIKWPEEWVDTDGAKMLDILEQRQSVHLRPSYYPFLKEII